MRKIQFMKPLTSAEIRERAKYFHALRAAAGITSVDMVVMDGPVPGMTHRPETVEVRGRKNSLSFKEVEHAKVG